MRESGLSFNINITPGRTTGPGCPWRSHAQCWTRHRGRRLRSKRKSWTGSCSWLPQARQRQPQQEEQQELYKRQFRVWRVIVPSGRGLPFIPRLSAEVRQAGFSRKLGDRNNFECHFSDCLHRNPIRFFVMKLAPQIRSVDRFCRFALGQISQIHTLLVKTHLKHKFTNVINSTVHKWIRHHLSGHFAMSFHPFVVMSTCNLETKLQDEIKLRLL